MGFDATGATGIFTLQLFGDLVDDGDTALANGLVDRGELGGLRLEIRERGEDLAARDEPALFDTREELVDVARRRFGLGGFCAGGTLRHVPHHHTALAPRDPSATHPSN